MPKTVKPLSESAEEKLARLKKIREMHWYALVVHIQQERKLVKILRSKGIEAFVPVRQERHRWSDRIKVVDIVQTPGVIFVRISMDRYKEVFISQSIKSYLYAPGDKQPCPISDERMAVFMRVAECNYEFRLAMPEAGDDVMVVNGPLKGLVGELVKADGEEHLLLQMNLAMGAIIKINLADVQRVPKGTKSVLADQMPKRFV